MIFVRARSEVYDETSRIPKEIKPATPQEDASRRDFTINALFYNMKTGKVVDFTGQGLKDLITGTLRAPGNPLVRFMEDPLRVIRAVRFASKYNCEIEPETYEAMLDPEVRSKIIKMNVPKALSKDRIGQEFKKILGNPNLGYAMKLLKDSGLWQDIVTESLVGTKYEGKMEALDMEQNNPWHELTLWGHTMQLVQHILEKYKDAESETKITMVLAALMHDMGKLFSEIHGESKSHPGKTSYHGHEKESREIAEHILKYLKMNTYIKQVTSLARYHMQPHQLSNDDSDIRTLRKFIRRMGEQSLNWLDVFNIAAADAISKSEIIDNEVFERYKNFENKLQEAFLSIGAINEKAPPPILNGNEIMQILNISGGAWMNEITEFVKEMKDDNPEITKEEAKELLINRFPPNPPENPPSTPISMSQSCNIEAKSTGEKNENSTCSLHLYNNKRENLNELLKEKHYYEIFSILRELKTDFPNDERVLRLICYFMFELLIESKEFRNAELLQHLFSKAEDNFFDTVLCSYVFGMLVLLETDTEKDVIEEIGERMANMSPGTLKTILDKLPKDEELFHPDIKKKYEKSVCK